MTSTEMETGPDPEPATGAETHAPGTVADTVDAGPQPALTGSDNHTAPLHAESAHAESEAAAAHGEPVPLIESGQIRRAVTIAEKRTDLNWSVFIGALGADSRAQAEARHAELGPAAAKSVLIAVDPSTHRLEIVTGSHARTLIDDRSSALAAASMTSTFAVRDLDGGIARGILAMVEHVRRGG
ncbi:MAG: DUF5130 family protein [Actinocrinis sp.]